MRTKSAFTFIFILALVGLAAFYGIRVTTAFDGPTGSGGVGTGAISADSSNNLSIGTTTVFSDTRLFIQGSNSTTTAFAIQLKNQEGRPLFVLRNDGRMVVGPFPIGGVPTFPSSATLQVRGLIETVDSTGPNLSGGIRFPDGTTQTTAASSDTISAANVSAGDFGANTGGGNYTFPASLTVEGAGIYNSAGYQMLQGNATDWLRVGNGAWSTGMAVYQGTAFNGGAGVTIGEWTIQPAGTIKTTEYGMFLGGVHVGGTSDPGDDNLIVDGNVGIGNTNPGRVLDVADRMRVRSGVGTAGIWFANSGGSELSFIGINSESSPDTVGIWNNGWRLTIDNDGLIDANSNRITSVATPTASTDAATKAYVDAATQYQFYKTTGNSSGLNSWTTILNTTGPGILHGFEVYSTTAMTKQLRITIDSVQLFSSQSCGSLRCAFDISGEAFDNNSFMQVPFNIRFRDTLLVELLDNNSGSNASAEVYYSR